MLKEGYKKTEVGVIPEDWEVVKISHLANLITKGTTPSTYGFEFEEEGINFIKIENLREDGSIDIDNTPKISKECNEKLKRSQMKKNDILFSIAGSLGKASIVSDWMLPCNTNQALAIIRLNNMCDKLFIKYFLSSNNVKRYIDRISTIGAQPNMSLQQVGNINVILPSLKEQEKIAEILSSVDCQIDDTEKLIEKCKVLKKGLMQRLLTKGIGHTEFKNTEVGEIPAAWEVKRVKDVSNTMSGGTPSRSKKHYYENGIYSWVKTGELGSKYIYESEEKITEEAINNSSAKLVPIGSVIIAMYGATIGKLSININEVTTNQACCSIVCDSSVMLNEYLYYYLDYNKNKLIDLGAGGAQPNISQKIIRDFEVLAPTLKEQRSIAQILSSLDSEIEDYGDKKQKLEKLKKGLMQQLLTGKIRVTV